MNGGAILVEQVFLSPSETQDIRAQANALAETRVAVAGPSGRVTRTWAHVAVETDHPVCRKIAQRLGTSIDWAALYYLDPGASIHAHRDLTGASLNKRIRFHVPVITNDAVDFRVHGQQVTMRPGELWCLDTSYLHSVANRGREARVHLILEGSISDGVAAILPKGWRRRIHDVVYVGALVGAFGKALLINAWRKPETFAAQMRMVGRFLRWRVLGLGAAG